jgi:hypothetical protein
MSMKCSLRVADATLRKELDDESSRPPKVVAGNPARLGLSRLAY